MPQTQKIFFIVKLLLSFLRYQNRQKTFACGKNINSSLQIVKFIPTVGKWRLQSATSSHLTYYDLRTVALQKLGSTSSSFVIGTSMYPAVRVDFYF